MAWKDVMTVMLNAVLKDCNLHPYLENWECATARPSNWMELYITTTDNVPNLEVIEAGLHNNNKRIKNENKN